MTTGEFVADRSAISRLGPRKRKTVAEHSDRSTGHGVSGDCPTIFSQPRREISRHALASGSRGNRFGAKLCRGPRASRPRVFRNPLRAGRPRTDLGTQIS